MRATRRSTRTAASTTNATSTIARGLMAVTTETCFAASAGDPESGKALAVASGGS